MKRMEEEALKYSSGCESGWTMYLDQSLEKRTLLSVGECAFPCKNGGTGKEEEEEEDLSMVSDASSGPPLFHDDDDYLDENGCFCSETPAALAKKNDKRRRIQRQEQERHSSLMDDTASSHVLTFPKGDYSLGSKASMEDVLDFSIGFSATHFEGKSSLKDQYSFFQTTLPGKTTSSKQIRKEEKRNKIW
ncbi:protein SOB FIVE-LIKE 5-like [Aristolochia californica]|uniref:protein SOB FIVE-LIKE 5-like n=1 Tax=Aristolochia californica TaxID=171875 RepID=UPI0035E04B3D